ncbi:hypothetical protein MTO96_004925 [Rhipicephalus appendiculatus]
MALDTLAAEAVFFAVVVVLDVEETGAVAALVEAVTATAVVTPSLHCTSLHTSPPEELSSLSAVGRGVLGVTVKDGTSGGSSAQPADRFRSFGERCSGEGGLGSAAAAATSSSSSTRLSTSLCE